MKALSRKFISHKEKKERKSLHFAVKPVYFCLYYLHGERSSVGRAPGCGSGGRGFNPLRSPQKISLFDSTYIKKYLKKCLRSGAKIATLLLSFSLQLHVSGCGAIGSALALGARGCQFESGHPDHFFAHFLVNVFNLS